MTRLFVGHDDEGNLTSWTKPDEPKRVHDNGMLVYFCTERTETSTEVEVEVIRGQDDDIDVDRFTVDDSEPLDVEGPIFSRVFDELGYTLSDPGDFSWSRTEHDDECYEVEIHCPFTQVSETSDTATEKD